MLRRQLAASPQMVARFVQEARAVNMIKHPNIVDIFEFGELPDGRPFYVMELLEGTDLRSILTSAAASRPARCWRSSSRSARRCRRRTTTGIVHRDLKASNIFVAQRPASSVVKLLDFGIAKLLHPDAAEGGLTVVGTRLGTSYTMAPEQIRGDGVDARTDIYALGVVLYHLLTGQYPFRAETMTEIERQHLEAPPPRPSQARAVPPALDAVVLRCMEKTADRRFPDRQGVHRGAAGGGRHQGRRAARLTARAVAIYVEIRIADGADAESDEVLDDTSRDPRRDRAELPRRGDDAAAADRQRASSARACCRADAAGRRRARRGRGAGQRAGGRAGRPAPRRTPAVHVNISSTWRTRW